MKRILTWFMQGVLLVGPIAVIFYIIYLIFNVIDGLLRDILGKWLGFSVPGLGFIAIILLLTLLGFSSKYIITNPVRRFGKQLLEKAPLLKAIHSSLTDLVSAFVGKDKKFTHPALVCINKENNLWKIGFMTKQNMEEIGMPGLTAIYFPHSYNFSGELYLVAAENVKPLNIPPAEAMKFIVSGGVTNVVLQD
jgi:Uncharacterized conserved protein